MVPEKSGDSEMSTIHGRGSVEVGRSVVAQAAPDRRVTKVIVAVHGVGDQYSFATIQAVVNQFCHFHGEPAAVPLGRFHTGKPPFSISPPFPAGTFDHLAFAEVYWAKVPREMVGDQHTIEEAKKWAGTLVERLRLSWHLSATKEGCRNADYDRIKLVLEEMIQTLAVLERLSYLAARAGLFTFDLKKLLEDYLGDVQIVTEFDEERGKILKAFRTTMAEVYEAYPEAESFIIAHSEGTVISLLGLLEAGRLADPPTWLKQVRGFMTIGSPIDKHLILWPTLFSSEPPSKNFNPKNKIEWRNYYDRGDPIGFDLNGARAWIDTNGWRKAFNFSAEHDFGFVRYPFPGKAHVDYWNDREVFGHFIETVVKEPVPHKTPPPIADSTQERKGPRTLQLKKGLSYVMPYIGVTALVFLGVYILYKAVDGALDPAEVMSTSTTIDLVAGAALLLLGGTVMARVPRLTRNVPALILGAGIGLGIMFLGIKIGEGMGSDAPPFITKVSSELYMAVSVGLIVLASLMTAVWPSLGLKPLILLGTAAIAAFVGAGLWGIPANKLGPVWPVFLATAGFLYLWWLAALILDLVLVWHFLIHSPSRARETLAKMAGIPKR